MDKCRTCDAPVLWARTEAGKLMPVDPDPVPDGNLELIRIDGRSVARVREPDLMGTPRHKSHFATCPQGREWRAPAQHHSPESVAAALKIQPKISQLHQRILDAIKRVGPLTDEEIALAVQMNPSTARPRRIELVEAGRLARAGTGRTKSGRSAAQWDLTERTSA